MTTSFAISAELTYVRLRGLMPYFTEASRRFGVPLAVLLAIASRESRMGLALSADGTGDGGNGFGIMQIDKRHHPQFTAAHGPLDHQANITYSARFLASLLHEFHRDLRLAVAAYNGGAAKVQAATSAGLPADVVTTGGDYGADVLQRKQLIEELLGLSKATSAAAIVAPLGLLALVTYNYITKTNL